MSELPSEEGAADIVVPTLRLDLADEAATVALAQDIAAILAPGDVIALEGDLGAGKTTFARALLRALADDPWLEVPSPTFTLIQTYDLPRFSVAHLDLYRLTEASEMDELGLDDILARGAALVEWPGNAGGALPADALVLRLETIVGEEGRRATFVVEGGTWASRLARTLGIRSFLDDAGWTGAARAYLHGDASIRAYERVALDGRTAVLMNWPLRAPDPPVRGGLPYRRIARIAEEPRPFIAVAETLRARGISAPEVLASDLAAGFLLLEDLGSEGVVADGAPIAERYERATDVLAAFHAGPMPEGLVVAGEPFALPPYDTEALSIEAELLIAWYFPWKTGAGIAPAEAETFDRLWRTLADEIAGHPHHWVLRDYHSANLFWLPERDGLARIGIIDLQDTVIGSPAYDVASLVQDARVTVPDDLSDALVARYVAARLAADPAFDEAQFRADLAIMEAQRATKLLGLFVRLDRRDGKPAYLRHIPRIRHYLSRALQHPVLSDLRLWYETAGLIGPEDEAAH